ncbi:MAG: M48 family metalloprotease [Acidobacteria bacterium]|nr:M48 family metalloprotease [Acidobacteriota bacterium]
MAFRNTLKTAVLLGAIGGLFILLGSMFGGVGGATIGLLIALVITGGSYWFSDRLAVRAAHAVEVSVAEAPDLHAMVGELSSRAGLPMPRVYISPSPQPNAFATGRSPAHSAVAVTEGLLQQCPPAEVRAVLAHEMAHIRNRDILIGSIAAAIATAISFLANMAMFAGLFGGSSDEDEGPSGASMLLMAILAPIAAGLLQMAVSRSREFEADRVGSVISGDPRALAAALRRLDQVSQRSPMDIAPSQASAWIVNPLTGRRQDLSRLFMTHPPVEERIARLEQLAMAGA